jgi:hypothetical protein
MSRVTERVGFDAFGGDENDGAAGADAEVAAAFLAIGAGESQPGGGQ